MLKLNFSIAYDSVKWGFLFLIMKRMGLSALFTSLVRLVVEDVATTITINGACSKTFSIRRGVWQGCSLASYLYILAAKAQATTTRHGIESKELQGIRLFDGTT